MIVIEGKSEKSKKLENLIRKDFRNDNIVIIDTIGTKAFPHIDNVEHLILESDFSPEQAIEVFRLYYDKNFSKYDWIIFYVNADPELVETFKNLDRAYSQNFIVTIQNNNGLTDTYFV
ncbi:hypothetical protein ACDN41_12390 [Priestia aryabhattai]|uniref:hypothetical protein n=1 Tax=Priestia aryabhattai TaxID=412384 RepID=UPI0035323D3D